MNVRSVDQTNLVYRNLTADLPSNLIPTSQWESDWLVLFNTTRTRLVAFYDQLAEDEFAPVFMGGHTFDEFPCCEYLLDLNGRLLVSLQKITKSCYGLSLPRVKSYQGWIIAVISRLELFNALLLILNLASDKFF